MRRLTVGIFNDSFPPTIDGVANAAFNYARYIQRNHGTAIVATPRYPHVRDDYPFEVVRYPSAYTGKKIGYRVGYPFDPLVLDELAKQKIDIIHTHCPFISAVLARVLRYYTGAPVVLTYHTKFDIDIEKRVAFNAVRRVSLRFLMANINACDEVWVVSRGAGENLRSLGYTGEYVVMENGVDLPRGRAGEEQVAALRRQLGIGPEEAVFLFVGRMMWYKGQRLILDALRQAAGQGARFKMVFVGEGNDRPAIMEYARSLGLGECCLFPGAVRDRELLRAYYTMSDLFLFPSDYDTNGIVVREAAACSCASVLLRGSCAAEGVAHGQNGLLIDPQPGPMAQHILHACRDRGWARQLGQAASQELYISWEEAVAKAYRRYEQLIQKGILKRDDIQPELLLVRKAYKLRKNYQQGMRRLHYKAQRTERKVMRRLEAFFQSML